MSRSYKDTGINLKSMPMGETDRLLTILTVEHGLIRVIVPGARKHKSRLGGRSSQFVVNEVFIIRGKRLDKLVQAETITSFPGLSADLARLTASQYLAELVLCQALSEQPQEKLFTLLVEQLQQLEKAPQEAILPCLSHGIFHLLTLAGVAPELARCNVSEVEIEPDSANPDWKTGFSITSGGIVSLAHLEPAATASLRAKTPEGRYAVKGGYDTTRERGRSPQKPPKPILLSAKELVLLRYLEDSELITQRSAFRPVDDAESMQFVWQRIERILRRYAEYHFDRPIRSAALIDTCFPAAAPSKD
ncbi:DNA repair protein RecO [Oscillatoria sp. CS-180]|uniref:DNA repair protein RecO n=1 Tax=Oscillatoria sp. CS-180 TaxID=3021720 RepID=UPI00232F9667|nr:DNA repair protein RecO [Oscillatoria sp. CS-180]MDB9526115.1 DNA repair protein RecO [Oscillatoria sp. CS-180]